MEVKLNDEVQSVIYADSPLRQAVLQRLNRGQAMSHISGGSVNFEIIHFRETDSTNNRAKCYAAEGCKDRTLFVADCQTRGKGRRGRSWLSDSDSGLWMSLLLRPDLKPDKASMLTLVAALAVAEALGNIVSQTMGNTGLGFSIKWPNDIVTGQKKVCGILTEMGTDADSIDYVVIGIGINVNTQQIPESIRETATSLYLETGGHYQREDIIAEFIQSFEKYYNKFLENGSLKGIMEDYNNKLINRNRQVRVLGTSDELVGEALGIDETGALIVQTDDGKVKTVVAGEVSVRGIYGYV